MVVPTIHFAGNCKDAIDLYEKAFIIEMHHKITK